MDISGIEGAVPRDPLANIRALMDAQQELLQKLRAAINEIDFPPPNDSKGY